MSTHCFQAAGFKSWADVIMNPMTLIGPIRRTEASLKFPLYKFLNSIAEFKKKKIWKKYEERFWLIVQH